MKWKSAGSALLRSSNSYGRFWCDVLDGALHYHLQNPNVFSKYDVYASSTVSEICRFCSNAIYVIFSL